MRLGLFQIRRRLFVRRRGFQEGLIRIAIVQGVRCILGLLYLILLDVILVAFYTS